MKSKANLIYSLAFLLLCIAVFIYLNISLLNVIYIVIIIGGTFYSAVLVHELGHLVAGRWLGYRLQKLVIAPFVIEYTPKFSLRMHYSLVQWALCVMEVRMLSYVQGRKQYMLYLAAGSVANVLVTALCILIYFSTGAVLSLGVAACHLLLGIIALLPLSVQQSTFTDGLGIKILYRDDEMSRLYYDLLVLSYESMHHTNKAISLDDTLEQAYERLLHLVAHPPESIPRSHPLFSHAIYTLTTELLKQRQFEKCIQLVEQVQANRMNYEPWNDEVNHAYSFAQSSLQHQ